MIIAETLLQIHSGEKELVVDKIRALTTKKLYSQLTLIYYIYISCETCSEAPCTSGALETTDLKWGVVSMLILIGKYLLSILTGYCIRMYSIKHSNRVFLASPHSQIRQNSKLHQLPAPGHLLDSSIICPHNLRYGLHALATAVELLAAQSDEA